MPSFLIVDDDPVHRHLIRMILGELLPPGHAVEEAEGGARALLRVQELAAATDRLVVLVDQNMPAMSGLDFVRAARGRTGPRVEFVLWSTVLPDVPADERDRLGLRAVVAKPMRLDGFFRLLSDLAGPADLLDPSGPSDPPDPPAPEAAPTAPAAPPAPPA